MAIDQNFRGNVSYLSLGQSRAYSCGYNFGILSQNSEMLQHLVLLLNFGIFKKAAVGVLRVYNISTVGDFDNVHGVFGANIIIFE